MGVFNPLYLFMASLALYLLCGLLSLVLIRKHRANNIAVNSLCMLAALFGLASSLSQLLCGGGPITVELFRSTIPLIAFTVTLDALSAFFLLGLSVIAFCVSLYSIGYLSHYYGKKSIGLFNFLFPLFILSMALVLSCGNAVFFLFAWEAMSALSYFLVVFESEHEEVQRAGTLYLIMTGIGTAFLLAAFLLMYGYTGSLELSAGSAAIPAAGKNLMFICFLIGFGTKAGIIPLHIWLPAAHPAAPSNVSALMSGIMIKIAIYGILRFVLQYLGVQHAWWGAVLLALGMVSAVLGVAYAFVEQNIKRLLAFSSIENIGIILIGLGVSFIAFAQKSAVIGSLALAAALFHAFNHTLFKGGLFLGAGSIQYATHTKDMEKLGGLIKRLPATAALVLCFSLAISALAPFNGFVGEWLTFQSLFAGIAPGRSWESILFILAIAALALCGALAAASFAKFFGIAFLGKPRSEHAAEATEVPGTMRAAMAVLAALCLAVGLFSSAFLRAMDGVVTSLGGAPLAAQLQGDVLFAWLPLQLTGNAISPVALLVLLAALLVGTLAVVRLVGGKYIQRKYGTWDCGFEALNARMQYTGTGFSKPMKIVFRVLFRPTRELKASGGMRYHPERVEYTVTSESLFEKYLYEPVTDFVKKLSRRAKYSVQTGSIRRYLAYILAALVVLLIYNTFA